MTDAAMMLDALLRDNRCKVTRMALADALEELGLISQAKWQRAVAEHGMYMDPHKLGLTIDECLIPYGIWDERARLLNRKGMSDDERGPE